MKYWRGYIVAAALALLSYGLTQFAAAHSNLVDMVYPYATRLVQDFLAEWSAGVAFCLWQVLAVVLVVVFLASIAALVIFRWNIIQWLGWVLTGVSLLWCVHTGMYGLNQYASPLADDIRLNMVVVGDSITPLINATTYFRDKANELSTQVSRDESGNISAEPFAQVVEKAENGFDHLVYEKNYSVFAGVTTPVKELGWADMYSSMGIAGVTMPFTGEAAVNPQTPIVALPFIACHEMAHRMCIAQERDANFAGFLAASVNPSIEFQYSAYFMAYRYCYNALASANSTNAAAAAARVASGAHSLLKRDLNYYNTFFSDNRNETATKVAATANNTYIAASGDPAGTVSYDRVVDLLVNWHIEQVVLPSLTEEEKPFDPLDESQVDLSGIVNAR